MLFHDWTVLKLNLILTEEQLCEVDRLRYLGSCILSGARLPEEVFSLLQKVRLEFSNLIQS